MMSRDQIEQVSDDKPRRALVLSGGGSKGAFEAGVLQRLMGEEQRDYDLLWCTTPSRSTDGSDRTWTPPRCGHPGAICASSRSRLVRARPSLRTSRRPASPNG
ncbi:MAG: hypothetical protein E6J65_08085 [Deltaproteobacteria bacterium]|nr:MAG: hypothetical protein E6J65_08085 [Deltaproteobacteria bacterium]